jgi:osmoprotectant transport system substrate-binding protein
MRPRSLVVLTLLATLFVAAACSSGAPDRTSAGPRVTIVGQNFTEADVVSQLYRALLDEAGFSARVVAVGGRDIYLGRLEKGTVQVAGDSLSATTDALNNQAHGDAAAPASSADVDATARQLERLGDEVGLTPLRPARAELKSGFAVTRDRATRLGLHSLSDLGRLGQPVALAASPDCAELPDCAQGLENVYGVKISKVEPLGSGTPDTKAALVRGQVQLGQVATTDAQVGTDLVLLADDRHMLDAANVVPLVNSAWLSHHHRARAALDRLADVLTTEDLRSLTARVNAGRASARSVARAYLGQRGLLNSR